MAARKAIVGFEFPWIILLVVGLFIFGFFFLKANDIATERHTSPDGSVDWEAGFLANSLANHPVDRDGQTMTLGEFLSVTDRSEQVDAAHEAMEAVSRAQTPDIDRIWVGIVSEDGYVLCPGEAWRDDRDCGLSEEVSRVQGFSGYLDRLQEERSETGDVGIVVIPSEPRTAVVVVTR